MSDHVTQKQLYEELKSINQNVAMMNDSFQRQSAGMNKRLTRAEIIIAVFSSIVFGKEMLGV